MVFVFVSYQCLSLLLFSFLFKCFAVSFWVYRIGVGFVSQGHLFLRIARLAVYACIWT